MDMSYMQGWGLVHGAGAGSGYCAEGMATLGRQWVKLTPPPQPPYIPRPPWDCPSPPIQWQNTRQYSQSQGKGLIRALGTGYCVEGTATLGHRWVQSTPTLP
eukprot:532998_1